MKSKKKLKSVQKAKQDFGAFLSDMDEKETLSVVPNNNRQKFALSNLPSKPISTSQVLFC